MDRPKKYIIHSDRPPSEVPDWNIATIDGQPEVVINMPAIAALAKGSPLGLPVVMERMRTALDEEDYAKLVPLVGEEYR